MTKLVRINPEDLDFLNHICKKHGWTNSEAINKITLYLKRNKVDLAIDENLPVTHALMKLEKRLTGFIKAQEKERLDPLRNDVHFAIDLLKSIKKTDVSQEQMNDRLNEIVAFLRKVNLLLQPEEEKLKILKSNIEKQNHKRLLLKFETLKKHLLKYQTEQQKSVVSIPNILKVIETQLIAKNPIDHAGS